MKYDTKDCRSYALDTVNELRQKNKMNGGARRIFKPSPMIQAANTAVKNDLRMYDRRSPLEMKERKEMVEGLLEAGQIDKYVELLKSEAVDRRIEVRLGAIKTLGEMGDDSIILFLGNIHRTEFGPNLNGNGNGKIASVMQEITNSIEKIKRKIGNSRIPM